MKVLLIKMKQNLRELTFILQLIKRQLLPKKRMQKLMLTHISARYLAKEAKELEEEARDIFPNTQIAKDFDIIDIPFS